MNKNGTIFLNLLLLGISSVFFYGCFNKEMIVSGYNCKNFRNDMYGNDKISKNKDRFRSISIEKQYALYVCSIQYFHPPNFGIQVLFAERGVEIIEFLKNKLLSSSDDKVVRDIIALLWLMNQRGYYSVKCDDNLMNIVTRKVNSIVDPNRKTIAEKYIVEIGSCNSSSIQQE